jgi:hypothetical protein
MPLLRLRFDRELQGRLVIVGLLVLVALASAAWQIASRGERQGEAVLVHARIVSFGLKAPVTQPGQSIGFVLEDGTRFSIVVNPIWSIGCKSGDRVALHRRGLAYEVATPTCRDT